MNKFKSVKFISYLIAFGTSTSLLFLSMITGDLWVTFNIAIFMAAIAGNVGTKAAIRYGQNRQRHSQLDYEEDFEGRQRMESS